MKTPKASGALRWAPDPTPTYAHFAHPTLLRYVGKIRADQSWGPPLTKSWIRYCVKSECNLNRREDTFPYLFRIRQIMNITTLVKDKTFPLFKPKNSLTRPKYLVNQKNISD